MPVRAVLFDVGDTLWHAPNPPSPVQFRTMAAERARAVLDSFGIEGADAAAVARAAWEAIETAMRSARRGDLREPYYAELARDAVASAGPALTVPQVEELLEAIYISGAEGGKVAFEGAADVLQALKARGYLLATATNRAFGGPRFRSDLQESGLDPGWDAHSVSVEVGYLKPHPAVFEHALAQLGVGPSEALMVGNSLAEDIAGAQQLGIHTAWRRCKPDAEGVEPGFTFDDITQLLDCPLLEVARD